MRPARAAPATVTAEVLGKGIGDWRRFAHSVLVECKDNAVLIERAERHRTWPDRKGPRAVACQTTDEARTTHHHFDTPWRAARHCRRSAGAHAQRQRVVLRAHRGPATHDQSDHLARTRRKDAEAIAPGIRPDGTMTVQLFPISGPTPRPCDCVAATNGCSSSGSLFAGQRRTTLRGEVSRGCAGAQARYRSGGAAAWQRCAVCAVREGSLRPARRRLIASPRPRRGLAGWRPIGLRRRLQL